MGEFPEVLGPEPGARYNPDALWWQGERLHRAVLADYAARTAAIRPERDRLEAGFLVGERTARDHMQAFSAACVTQSREAVDRWIAHVEAMPVVRAAPWPYRRRWRNQSAAAELPVS